MSPGGVWGQQFASQSAGMYGFQSPGMASSYDAANIAMRGGGIPSYYGAGDNAVAKRQFADVGKVNLNLLDPLSQSRAATNYQPVDGEDGGLLGIGNYYNAKQPGGLFAGLGAAIGQTLGGVFGEGGAKTGSDIGTFIGKTAEMPMAAVGGVGIPFVAPVIDKANAEIEKVTPYILRDTLKIPTNVGGAFQSLLNVFGLAGTAVERTYAGMQDLRGNLPEDIQQRIDAGELTEDEALDEMVLTSRGFSNDPIHNMVWAVITDPANWVSLGVGAVGGAVKGTSAVARGFGALARAEEGAALASRPGRIGEMARAAQRGEAITPMVQGRGTLAEMRAAMDDTGSKMQLSWVEKMGMSALGPVSETTGNAVARVGNVILRATDPVNFFSGSKAGQRSMAQLSTASATGVIAGHGANNVNNLANIADSIVSDGSDRVMRAIGIQGTNALQEVATSDLVHTAMKNGAVPQMGTLTFGQAIRDLLAGGAYDTNVGKYVEVYTEKMKDLAVARLPKDEMYRQSVAKFAAVLGTDSASVMRRMKSVDEDQAIAIHALYYYTKGQALHTDVVGAMKTAQQAGTLAAHIDPERASMIGQRTLTTTTVKDLDTALATGNVDAIRQMVERFDDFNWMNRNSVPDNDLRDTVEGYLEANRSRLPDEVVLKDAAGNWLPNVPPELQRWAEDADTFGYKLGQRLPLNAPNEDLMRVTRGKDGSIININPYLDFWAEGGDSARKLNRFTATKMTMLRGVRQERIIWQQRRRFITDMAVGRDKGGVNVPPEVADRIFKALMYEAKGRYIQPRGMQPAEMMDAVHKVLDDVKTHGYGSEVKGLTDRQVVLTTLRALQGDIKTVGVTQFATGGIKAFAPGAGANYWGQISERLYPLMRFTLNPVFQTMELVEPYILSVMRGIRVPLRQNSEGFREALATRNAINQMVYSSDAPDGIGAEFAEALALNLNQAVEAKSKFGRGNPLTRWMPNIGGRKEVAAALETERLIGDNLYAAFKQIKGDSFEAFWGDLERMYGTTSRATVGKRWLAANFPLMDMNGHRVSIMQDILSPKVQGRRFRVNDGGTNGAYSFADVEEVFDHHRANDGSWQTGLRKDRGLKAGEALKEDLRGMSREAWHQEVQRYGLITDPDIKVVDRAADDIWRAVNGPDVKPFWKGYRDTFLPNVRGADAAETRAKRNVEVNAVRSLVKVWADSKMMTEEEFIKLHFDDIPKPGTADDLTLAGALFDIRRDWVTRTANTKRFAPMGDAWGWASDHGAGIKHYLDEPIEQTMASDTHWVTRMPSWQWSELVDGLAEDAAYDGMYSMPKRVHTSMDSLMYDMSSDDAIVRISKQHGQEVRSGVGEGVFNLKDADIAKTQIELLGPDGVWRGLGSESKLRAPAHPAVMDERIAARYIYGTPAGDVGETGITRIDLDSLFTDEERVGMDRYTGSTYIPINRYWRGHEQDIYSGLSEERILELSDSIDAAILKGQSREPMVLRRGIDLTNAEDEGLDLTIDYEGLEVGDTYADPAYVSTSSKANTAEGFAGGGSSWANAGHRRVLLEVEAPAGMHMAIIEGAEGEYIFGRGTEMQVIGKFVEKTGDMTTTRLRVQPVGSGHIRGVRRLAMGEMAEERRAMGRMAEQATTDPEGLRALAREVEDRDRFGVLMDAERAIANAEAAKPYATPRTIGKQRFGALSPSDTLDDIEAQLDPEEIEAISHTFSDLRDRVRTLMSSEEETWGPPTGIRAPTNSADTRMLAALATVMNERGMRTGLNDVLRAMETFWEQGPSAAMKSDDPLMQLVATHVFRGSFALGDPFVTNRMNDALDALLGNTSRRATGRVTDMTPIFADDRVAEAAGYLTPSAYAHLRAQGLIEEADVPPNVIVYRDIPGGPLPMTKQLGGSTGAIQVQDNVGGLYVEKRGANPDHIIEEHITDNVYEAMGVPVPHQNLQYMADGTPIKRSVMVEDATSFDRWWQAASDTEREGMKTQLQSHFALDALLANWDVVGLVGDNILVKNGVAIRVDNGGSLRFRAMGAPKGRFFGDSVSELKTLRDHDMNEWAARVFDGISEEEIRRQVEELSEQRAIILDNVPAELRGTINARIDDMLAQTDGVTPAPRPAGEATAQTLGRYEHEYLVRHYNEAASAANARGMAGRSDWTASDIALLAAHSRERMGGLKTAPSMAEFERAAKEISNPILPGEGHELSRFNPLFEMYGRQEYRAEKQALVSAANVVLVQEIRDRLGIIIDHTDEAGIGMFDAQDASMVATHVFSTRSRALDAADVISYATGQPNVAVWTDGPHIDDITDFSQYTPRITLVVPDDGTDVAERLAKHLGQKAPGALDATAMRDANGNWVLSVADEVGAFERMPNGSVNELKAGIDLDELFEDFDNPPNTTDLMVDYGHIDRAAPNKLEDGSYDWDGYEALIISRAKARGTTINPGDLDSIRDTYTREVRTKLRRDTPANYARIERSEPITNVLEDRRGGNVLGTTSPRGAAAAAIRGFNAADPLTGLHELIHVFSLSGMDPSLREAVAQAYDLHHFGNEAAINQRITDLTARAAAATNKSVKQRHLNEVTRLQQRLASPDPHAWTNAHEEFFVQMVLDWIDRGAVTNPELGQAFNHFRNWTQATQSAMPKVAGKRVRTSPAMEAKLNRMFARKTVDSVPYSAEQQTMLTAAQQVVRTSWDEAHATQFYKRDRSMLERSINHPYIGLYPASYMWGKVLPEMLRFLALRPFGMETPFLAWNVAREVSDSIRSQAEVDEGFKKFLADNEDAFMLMSMLFPALPSDTPANASLPVRRIAEQGLENQRKYAAGMAPDKVTDIDYAKGSMDAIQYAVGPLGSIRTATEVTGKFGDLARSLAGEAIPGDETPFEALPVR